MKALNIVPLAPIREATNLSIPMNVTAISFRNGGETGIILWNGAWELKPGETLSFNILESTPVLRIENIPVFFDTQVGRENKLQVIVTAQQSNC